MFDFLRSLRWMPILSVLALALGILLVLISKDNFPISLVLAVSSLTLAMLSKQE